MIKIHNKHHKEKIVDPIYIGRPSPLGNPFSHMSNTKAEFKVSSRDEAVYMYEVWLRSKLNVDKTITSEMVKLFNIYKSSGELNLVCWCYPNRCHGDIIKKLILEKYELENEK